MVWGRKSSPGQSPAGEIRRAVRDDLPRLFDICRAARENRLRIAWESFSREGGRIIDAIPVWVWSRDGELLGFAHADPSTGWVEMLYVHPAAEGQGIGRALLRRCCDDLRLAGHRVATLCTESGTRAERFYRKDGWMATGEVRNGDIILIKRL